MISLFIFLSFSLFLFEKLIELLEIFIRHLVGKISFIKKFTILSYAERFTFSLLIFRYSVVHLFLLFLFSYEF